MADYYDSSALLDRLSAGIQRAQQRVTFLVGSALTAPTETLSPGVPGVDGVIDIIRKEFDGADQTSNLYRALSEHENRYQAAFTYLLGHRGQQAANEVIKRAVWKARKPVVASENTGAFSPTAATSDETCRSLDSDYEGLACTRFRRHRVRCFDGTGGVSWRGGSLHESSSLRLCG